MNEENGLNEKKFRETIDKLKFYAREYIGVEVLYRDEAKGVVQSKYGLVLGDKYVVLSYFGFTPVTVTKVDYENGTAETLDGNFASFLQFDRDDRHCWVCVSAFNAAAIAKIELS